MSTLLLALNLLAFAYTQITHQNNILISLNFTLFYH